MDRKSLLYSFLFLLGGILLNACSDDWDTRNDGDSAENVVVKLGIPLAADTSGDPEKKLVNMHLFAFTASGDLLTYHEMKKFTGEQVLFPIGKCDIFLVANYPADATKKMTDIASRTELEALYFAKNTVTTSPFLMMGAYRGVQVNDKGQIMYGAADISKSLLVERLAAKLTLNLSYMVKAAGESPMKVDSVKLCNLAGHAHLIPQAYVEDAKKFPMGVEKKEENMKDTTAVTYEFYLPEYIIGTDESGKKSTYASIFAHVEDDAKTKMEYKLYIGDWFGFSAQYNDFNWETHPDEPAKVSLTKDEKQMIGLAGLSVSRNMHYTFDGRINGDGLVPNDSLKGEVSVVQWKEETLDESIIGYPTLDLSTTNVQVNLLTGTYITYVSNINDASRVSVDISQPGTFAFVATVTDHSIYFKINHNRVKDWYNPPLSDTPISTTATITVTSPLGNKMTKKINLVVLNPISKKNTAIYKGWSKAMGYKKPYTLDYYGLKGKNLDQTHFTQTIPSDTVSACAEYYEGTADHIVTGKGHWRAASFEETKQIQNIVLWMNTAKDYEQVDFDNPYFTTNSKSATTVSGYKFGYETSTNMQKSAAGRLRCVLENSPVVKDDATYLNVSHDYYEVPLGDTPKEHISSVPIYYESDQSVSIALYDSEGKEISTIDPREQADPYFLGYNIETDEEFTGKVAQLYMPSSLPKMNKAPIIYEDYYLTSVDQTRKADKKKGLFYLFANIMTLAELYETLTPYMLMPAQPTRMVYNSPYSRKPEFTLVFTAGTKKKSIRIRAISLASNKALDAPAGTNSYSDALSISPLYTGYNLSTNTMVDKWRVQNQAIDGTDGVLVSDNKSGCANYYEGSPSDPEYGKGNWYLTNFNVGNMGVVANDRIYVVDANSSAGITNRGFKVMSSLAPDEGIGGFIKNDIGVTGVNLSVWHIMNKRRPDLSGNGAEAYFCSLINKKNLSLRGKSEGGHVRCTRRINIDKLQLDESQVVLDANHTTVEIGYYTSSDDGIEIQKLQPTSPDGGNTDNIKVEIDKNMISNKSGKIRISVNGSITKDFEMNILINTKRTGYYEAYKTYRIIKVKMK